MIKKILLNLTVVCCMIIGERALAQTTPGDSTNQNTALASIADAFNNSIDQQSRLYNGPEYDLYSPAIRGNAYFADNNTFVQGTVTYDGIFYKNVPMMYDIYKGVVAVQLYNKISIFTLLNERVESFDLLNHHFVYIKTDSIKANAGIKTGFYDQLYSSNLEVLVKSSKEIQNTSSTSTIETYFTTPSLSFYLRKGSNYYSINGQSTLLTILKDKKKELQQYIKTNKIRYKKNPEEALVAIAARYDALSR